MTIVTATSKIATITTIDHVTDWFIYPDLFDSEKTPALMIGIDLYFLSDHVYRIPSFFSTHYVMHLITKLEKDYEVHSQAIQDVSYYLYTVYILLSS